MKITWVSYDFAEYCIRLANAIAEEHDVTLILASESADGASIDAHPLLKLVLFERPRLRQPVEQVATVIKVLHTVKRSDPEVIHYQHGHLWFNLALPMLRKNPLVVTIHDPRHHIGDFASRKTPQRVMDFGYRRADHVIVHGGNLVRVVHEKIGIARERIHVVPHVAIGGIDTSCEYTEEGKTVLFFGRIWEYKGLEYLIRAEPLISRQIPDVRIVIAGKGEDFDRYRGFMTNPERFEVHNAWIDDDLRAELFQRAAVVVLPYISATQSGVVPVAYTFGKPVVATRVGALPECVDHGRSGLLVPPRDEGALAEAIVSLLRDEQLRRSMGECGRRRLQEEWAPEVVARRTIEVYQVALRNRGRPSIN